MLIDTIFTFFAGTTLIPQVSGAPTLDTPSTPDPSIFPELQRAAQLSSAAYTDCNGTAFDIRITKKINEVSTDTQGYIGYSESKKRISVVMKGSTTTADYLNDIDLLLVVPELSGVTFPEDAKIMQGISKTWGSLHDAVVSEVTSLVEKYPEYSLEATGHSLGGSLTYISYIALSQLFPGKEIIGNAIAAYPIGNQEFADFGSSQKSTLNRGNNADDGVPNLFVTIPGFKHYGTEYYSSGTRESCVKCEGERDESCSAGNGKVGITDEHSYSFGIHMAEVGCGVTYSLLR